MLEKLDLTLSLPKEEYKARLTALQKRLFELQSACWRNAVGAILVFEGWDASGVGSCLNLLTSQLEPRGFRLHAIEPPRTYETHMPWLWRFWLKVPNYGQTAIFDRSWYRRVREERLEKVVPKAAWQQGYIDIAGFERGLADDGYIVRKFFFHISKKEQKKRFEKSEKDPLDSWHVRPDWWERHRNYEKYLAAAEEMLAKTDAEWAPWTIVEATDRRWARIKVFETIAQALEAGLKARGLPLPGAAPAPAKSAPKPAPAKSAGPPAPAKTAGRKATAAARRS
jgi:polyphosphate kinase 2 (PPK2 family)